ncbi:MAG: CotH kinase family protein [Lachnospiraceae bacterium]|nr:CotH kinase family protein [Lachnospiraceae bacterium]
MIKRKRFTSNSLFYVVTCSAFLLSFAACNSTPPGNEVPGTNTPTPITDTATDATPAPVTNAVSDITSAPDESANKQEEAMAPVFSADGGFYKKAFLLELSSPDDSEIFFTKDGSDPRTSDTATLYTKGIFLYNNTDEPNVYSAIKDITLTDYNPPQYNIDKGFTIRAVLKSKDGTYGSVVTNSYFIGKSASYYSEMKVISMVTDKDYLFHKDTGAYMIGSKYYEWLESEDFVQYDAGDVLNVTNYNTSGRETEFPVSVQVFENGKSMYSADIGARISGNWSRAHAQKSFRLYARKEYGDGKMRYAFFDELTDVNGELIEKFDKVTIRNGGNDYQELHFRDALFHDLTKDLAIDVMASEPCILFINGEFWGFYMIREKTDGDYIESHYGIPKEDVAVIKNSGIEEGTEEDLEEFRQFCIWAASADLTDEKNYKKFCDSVDIQSLMDYVTVETYVNNNDWANGVSNNWEAWHAKTVNPDLPKADGKWRFILYDTEFSSGLYNSENTQYKYDLLNRMSVGEEDFNIPDILRNACKNDTFRQAFYDNYLHIMETCFDSDTVSKKIDEYAAAYGAATKDTFFRFGMDWAAWSYDNEVNEFKNYFSKRPKYAKRYLNTFCGIETEASDVSSENLMPETITWNYYGDAEFFADVSDNSFHVTVPRQCTNVWDIQSQSAKLTLEEGCDYRLTFEASSTNSSSIKLFFNRFDGWGYPNCWVADASLTPELKQYTFEFTMDSYTEHDWKLCLNFGHGTGDFVFKNVSLNRMTQ